MLCSVAHALVPAFICWLCLLSHCTVVNAALNSTLFSTSPITLNGIVVISPPWTQYNKETDKFEGYMVEFAEEVARRTNITINFTQFDGDYAEAINSVANSTFDIFVGDVSVTWARANIVNFTAFTEFGSFSIGVSTGDRATQWNKLTRPFTTFRWTVWLGIFVGMCSLAVSVWLYSVKWKRTKSGPYTELKITDAAWVAFFIPLGGPVNLPQGRWMTIVASFVFLTLLISYTSHLTSQLTVDSLDHIPPRHISDFAFREVGLSTSDFITRVAHEIGLKKLHHFSSSIEAIKAAHNGTVYGVITDSDRLTIMAAKAPFCDMVPVTTDIRIHPYAWPMSKSLHRVTEMMNDQIVKLREEEFPLQLRKRWIEAPGDCPPAEGSGLQPLGLQNVGGVLLIYPLLFVIVLLRVSVGWVMFKRRKANWEADKNNDTPQDDLQSGEKLLADDEKLENCSHSELLALHEQAMQNYMLASKHVEYLLKAAPA